MAASEGDEMIDRGQSCYRVSVLSGSLEVSARLKSADDLEILMRVLEANKVVFSNGDRVSSEAVEPRPELAKVDRTKKKRLANAKQLKRPFSEDPETEVLILT
jgi:hypothetical protein